MSRVSIFSARRRSGTTGSLIKVFLSEQFENVIVLSDEFYQEIMAHPIPADLEAMKLLSGSPAVMDLFLWLCYRCLKSRGLESIPLFGASGLTSQLGTVEYSRPRRFRAMLDQWLRTIHCLWPECPAEVSSDGNRLIIRPAIAIWPERAAID
jgi:hypothetical protein